MKQLPLTTYGFLVLGVVPMLDILLVLGEYPVLNVFFLRDM